MWTLRNLLLALKIRSLIHKWIVTAWWQQCLEHTFANHPGVVPICFWMGKCRYWFHWRQRSVDWYCSSLKYGTAYISLLAHERQGNAQVICLASGASCRHQCKSTAVWLLYSSRSQSEILVPNATGNRRHPQQYVFKCFFPQFKMYHFFIRPNTFDQKTHLCYLSFLLFPSHLFCLSLLNFLSSCGPKYYT